SCCLSRARLQAVGTRSLLLIPHPAALFRHNSPVASPVCFPCLTTDNFCMPPSTEPPRSSALHCLGFPSTPITPWAEHPYSQGFQPPSICRWLPVRRTQARWSRTPPTPITPPSLTMQRREPVGLLT